MSEQENYRYFYIDRKLTGDSFAEITEAMQSLNDFVPKIKKKELLNSLVIRLLDLLQNAQTFYIKIMISQFFRTFASLAASIQSKQEIVIIVTRCLKGSDDFTKIIALQIASTMTALFEREIGFFELLLEFIRRESVIPKPVEVAVISCLRELLNCSEYLSELFAKKIQHILRNRLINPKILFYLCSSALIPPTYQQYTIEQLYSYLYQNRDSSHSKILIKYFLRMVLRFCDWNYRLISFCEKALPFVCRKIEQQLSQLKIYKYPFLCAEKQESKLQLSAFLDELHGQRHNGMSIDCKQTKIEGILKEMIDGKQISSSEGILLSFYCCRSHELGIDQAISVELQAKHWPFPQKLLKMCLITRNFLSAQLILSKLTALDLPMNRRKLVIFLSCYSKLQLMIRDPTNYSLIAAKLKVLLQFSIHMHSQLATLVHCWNVLIDRTEANYHDIREKLNLVSQKGKFRTEKRLNDDFLQKKEKWRENPDIPFRRYDDNQLWCVYLSKSAVQSLFSMCK